MILYLLGDDHVVTDRPSRDFDYQREPRRGNTIYAHGFGVTEEILRKAFSNFGTIINISMELDKK